MHPDFEKLSPFTQRVIEVVHTIPVGQVCSYGDVAALAGSPKASRQVARVLSSCGEKYQLPWHRVVNKVGEIAMKDPVAVLEQMARLRSEGVEVTEAGKIIHPVGS